MILIVYASKSGTAKTAAEQLSTLLGASDLVDLTKQTPALANYDTVIIGSGVRMGAIHKTAKDFIAANADELKSKKWGLFITNSFADSVDEIINAALSEDMQLSAKWVGTVGGKIDIDNLKGIDKFIAKAVSKSTNEGQKIHDGISEATLGEIACCFMEN